ncbi:MAG TPA: Uma2 family endonuclease [Gemmatimonadaceae bacterium]
MATAAKRWTVDEVRALIDESRHWPRYELVDGELLVTPAPRMLHQSAVLALAVPLRSYCEENALGRLLTSPADIGLEPDSIVQPDIFLVPPATPRPREWSDVRSLRLAVEILSPGSARHDRTVKRRLYQRNGVPEYWIVDLDARLVERWRPDDERPEILEERLVWEPAQGTPPFVLELQAFFAGVLDE